MPFHKELFKDLPPEDDVRRSFEGLRKDAREADGFYALVQDIAAKFGDKAYELAEAVFQEHGMKYDALDLRTPGKIRRVGYGFDGGNMHALRVKAFERPMLEGVVRCYRNIFRRLSPDMLMTAESFEQRILSGASHRPDGLLIASNPLGMTLGFVHCCAEGATGSVEAFAFYPGRMHEQVAPTLLVSAAAFFQRERASSVRVFEGRLKYPFHGADLRAGLPYLASALAAGAARHGWSFDSNTGG